MYISFHGFGPDTSGVWLHIEPWFDWGVAMSKLGQISAACAVLCLGIASTSASAYDYTYTDINGSFYGLSIGLDSDGSPTTETRLISLDVVTSGNNDLTRYLDAAAIKVSDSVTGSLTSFSLGSWTYVDGGTNSGGCSGTGSGFMCAKGHELLGPTYSFAWTAVMDAGKLFNGTTDEISLKAVYNAGMEGKDGYYQVSMPMVPVPEPEAYGLALAGMLVVGFAMRRKA